MNIDEKHIKTCIELSRKAVKKGDNPFGAVIAEGKNVLVKTRNRIKENDVTNHAEIMAMRKAQKIKKTDDFSGFTIYSNCEPCPMCSFMIRELKFGRVVFSLDSPYMGGYNKWNILKDEDLLKFTPIFAKPPEVISGILKEEARKVFKKAGWTMAP